MPQTTIIASAEMQTEVPAVTTVSFCAIPHYEEYTWTYEKRQIRTILQWENLS